MNNSKTNKDKKMQFAPNGWKRNRFLYDNEKNSFVGDHQMVLQFLILQNDDLQMKKCLQVTSYLN